MKTINLKKVILPVMAVAATIGFADVASAPIIQPVSVSAPAVAPVPAVQPAPTVVSAPSDASASAEEYEPGALCHLYAMAPVKPGYREV